VRVGIGVDAHQFAAGRRLVLCGVEVPYGLGLLGYSDADVGTHAVIDAMLGAAALGDIGTHFPTGDPRFACASSLDLLGATLALLHERGYAVNNVDVTIVAARPRLADHIAPMRGALANAIGVPLDSVSVKATTTDHLGFVGRREGIAAVAVVSLM
jgi:2-C-methyl-D-erythritol 2,4-cyclodiphosphate synthase